MTERRRRTGLRTGRKAAIVTQRQWAEESLRGALTEERSLHIGFAGGFFALRALNDGTQAENRPSDRTKGGTRHSEAEESPREAPTEERSLHIGFAGGFFALRALNDGTQTENRPADRAKEELITFGPFRNTSVTPESTYHLIIDGIDMIQITRPL